MFDLVRFGCGGVGSCQFGCGGPTSCKRLSAGGLEDAIRLARELLDDDSLSVIEVRDGEQTICTVGQGWISRWRRPPKPETPPLNTDASSR